jgi:hypothetical protein
MCFPQAKKGLTWANMWINGTDAINYLVSGVGFALGIFILVAPDTAAAIWGSERIKKLALQHRSLLLQSYRAFGAILCLSAILFAIDTMGSR